MHHLRQQWSDLMGSIEEGPQSFTDENVCKYFLTGLCPHDLFENEVRDASPTQTLAEADCKATSSDCVHACMRACLRFFSRGS